MRWYWLALSLTLSLACTAAPPEVDEPILPEGKGIQAPEHLIDLTHSFGPDTIYWPTDTQGFQLEILQAGPTDLGFYYAANRVSGTEHGGTHLDAPIHFYEGGSTSDAIALERLVAPGIVITVKDRVAEDRNYQIQIADLVAWESENGEIPSGSILLFETGFGEHWPDREAYLGTAKRGPEAIPELQFPGLSPEAAHWIASQRQIAAVGIDTASIDFGQSTHFESHVHLFEADIPAFENVAHLNQLPGKDFLVVALPMKIEGGSGGPLRIIAMW